MIDVLRLADGFGELLELPKSSFRLITTGDNGWTFFFFVSFA